MLTSSLIGSSADLNSIAAGGRTMREPEASDAVLRVQTALLSLGFELPEAGADGIFGQETAAAVVAFKTSRGLFPNNPVVGVGTATRLDVEIAYLEGVAVDQILDDDRVLASDPYLGARIDVLRPDLGIPDKILRFFELSDEFCLPLSALWGPQVASTFGKLVDPKMSDDYCATVGPCVGDDFFDLANNSTLYTLFLELHNPAVPPPIITQVGDSVRPDILRHRPGSTEWYETKPMTPSGVIEFLAKAKVLVSNYALGFPYVPGTAYRPSREIPLGAFIAPGGGRLEIFIEPRRPAKGMILYRICIRGDYVRYFNDVRIGVGILAIMAALAPEILALGVAAEEVAAYVAAIRALAAEFGGVLPVLIPSP